MDPIQFLRSMEIFRPLPDEELARIASRLKERRFRDGQIIFHKDDPGEAMYLIAGGSPHFYSIGFGIVSLLLQVFLDYKTYVKYLKWLTLALLSYVALAFTINVDWMAVLKGALLPHVALDNDTITIIVETRRTYRSALRTDGGGGGGGTDISGLPASGTE